MNELDQMLSFLPPEWRGKATLLIMASPYITRSVYALTHGKGIKGLLSSIWLGTNTPKASDKPSTPTAQ